MSTRQETHVSYGNVPAHCLHPNTDSVATVLRIVIREHLVNWDNHSEISTSDLVEYMFWKGEGDAETEEHSRSAFAVFCNRFGSEVMKKCEILCHNHGHSPTVALQIAERTFSKFLNSKSFDFNKHKSDDYDKAVIFYLFAIAYHELVDYHRELKGLRGTKYSGDERVVYDIADLDIFDGKVQTASQLRKIREVLNHALSGLNENQKIIYLTYFNAKVNPGEKPPRHLTKMLRETTGLTQTSIRSEINRARKIVDSVAKVYAKEK